MKHRGYTLRYQAEWADAIQLKIAQTPDESKKQARDNLMYPLVSYVDQVCLEREILFTKKKNKLQEENTAALQIWVSGNKCFTDFCSNIHI